METQTWPLARGAWLAVRAALVLALLPVSWEAVQAQGALLSIRQFRDAGGLPPKLNVRLTSALERYLKDQSGDKLAVSLLPISGPGKSVGPGRYLLEGDVSYASGHREDAGKYLMTVRLFRTGGPSALIGQWTGVSSSLRTLTANLHQERGLNRFGLVGEFGVRIATVISGDAAASAQRFSRLASRMRPAREERPDILSAAEPPSLLQSIKADAAFRLRFHASPQERSYHLLAVCATGELRQVALAEAAPKLSTPSGHSRTSIVLHLPEGALEAWVVWQKVLPAPSNTQGALFRKDWNDRTHNTSTLRRKSTCAFAGAFMSPVQADTEATTVQILEGIGAGRPDPDPEIERILTEISREPARWQLCRIPIVTDRN